MSKSKKIVKRVFIGLAILIVLLIGALAAAPFLFKDQIVAAVKNAANDNLRARLDFSDVSLSLLRNFPGLSVGIKDLQIIGVDEFDGVPFLECKSLGMTIDFWSALNYGKVPLNIRSISIEQPSLNIAVLRDGQANYDIALPSEDTTAAETTFSIALQRYAITDGRLVYDDKQSDLFAEVKDLNHSGSGDFTQDVFDLLTKTLIGELTLRSGAVTYLKKAHLRLDAGFQIDLPNSRYTLKENDLRINALQLLAEGWLAMPDADAFDMDLRFSAPGNEFKELLSLIPSAYIQGYENVKADGTFTLSGFVKGRYSDQPAVYPAFHIDAQVNNGSVHYPGLPLGLSNIQLKTRVESPGPDFDKLLVDVSTFHLSVGDEPVEGYFRLRTPISDPDVDMRLKGKLDLATLAKAYPLDGVQTLAGLVDADVVVKTRMSTIDRGDYANVQMNGRILASDVRYEATGLPPVFVQNAQADFTPRRVEVPAFSMKLGKSDLRGSAQIDNALAWFSPDATMRGTVVLRSAYFNADEWLTGETPAEPTGAPIAGSTPVPEEKPFNRFDFSFDGKIDQLDYDAYQLSGLTAAGRFTPDRLTLRTLAGQIGESDFAASGELNNVWNYLFDDEVLAGELNFKSGFMDLNPFMTTEAEPDAPTEPIAVPANMSLVVNADLSKLLYDNMELTNLRGTLTLRDEQARFDGVQANLLGGTMELSGGYDSRVVEKPTFDIVAKLKQMDFQRTFNTFNTVQAIAPLGKFVEGIFSTELSMSSTLTKDLLPDLNQLNLSAFLQTSNATISGFAPLQEVGNKLNVEELKRLIIKETKNWLTVEQGVVTLQDFDYTQLDIPMRIGGMHRINGDMEYHIMASIPRDKIGSNPVGATALSGMDFLSKEASKIGVNLNAGDFINVEIGLGGSITKPKVNIRLLGSGGKASLKEAVAAQVEAEAKAQVEETKAALQEELDAGKKKAEDAATKAVEDVKKDMTTKVDTTAKKAEETVKKAAEDAAKKQVDEGKKQMEKINPFKKKKKGNDNQD